jgi:hypothetical protein
VTSRAGEAAAEGLPAEEAEVTEAIHAAAHPGRDRAAAEAAEAETEGTAGAGEEGASS